MSIYAGNKKIAGLIRGEDISHATELHAGIIEIANQEEVNLGTDDLKAVTPLKLKTKVDKQISDVEDKYMPIIPKKEATGTNTLEYDKSLEFDVFNSEIEGNEYQYNTTGKNKWNDNLVKTTGIVEKLNTGFKMINNKNGGGRFSPLYVINLNAGIYKIVSKHISNLNEIGDVTLEVTYDDNSVAYVAANSDVINFGNINKGVKFLRFYFQSNIEEGKIIEYSDFMILDRNELDETYEPYTGNEPSPSPDYPQEVQTLKGYNLIDISKSKINTRVNVGGEFYYNGTNVTDFISIDKDKQYYVKGVHTSSIMVPAFYYDKDKNYISYQSVIVSDFILEIPSNAKYVRFNYPKDKSPQLTEGTTEKPYLPYGCIGKKYTGRNLAYDGWAEDFVNRVNQSGYARMQPFDNKNCVRFISAAGYGDYDNKYLFKTIWKENTQYTFNLEIYNVDYSSTNIAINYTDGTRQHFGTIKPNVWTKFNIKSNPNKTIKYLRPSYDEGVTFINLDTSMIYEGTDDIPYEPYKEKIQKIDLAGNELLTTDKLITDYKGNAYIEKKWGKYVLDGSEDWAMNVLTNGIRFFIQKNNIGLKNINSSGNDIISDYFKGIDYSIYYSKGGITGISYNFYNSNNYIQIFLEDNSYDERSFKARLQQHPVTVYYQLETPEIIELPKVEPVKSFKGYNHVEVLATLEPTYMKDVYANDVNKEIEELKMALISVNGN